MELDYAFLADYAVVEGGKLTAVGASWTRLQLPVFPSMHQCAVAGRVRAPESAERVPMRIRFAGPPDTLGLDIGFELVRDAATQQPYDGKLGYLFAAMLFVPIMAAGLYQIHINIEGQDVRRLAFEASGLVGPRPGTQ